MDDAALFSFVLVFARQFQLSDEGESWRHAHRTVWFDDATFVALKLDDGAKDVTPTNNERRGEGVGEPKFRANDRGRSRSCCKSPGEGVIEMLSPFVLTRCRDSAG